MHYVIIVIRIICWKWIEGKKGNSVPFELIIMYYIHIVNIIYIILCVYIYIYVYIYVCMYVCMYIYIYIYICMYIYVSFNNV